MTDTPTQHSCFSQKVLHWYDQFGRKNLPWQRDINPYRVWVSEIMLQQTQVKTVIPYFQRFMDTFPTVEVLAKAQEDQVLHLWSGLGYYARARNLHKTANIVYSQMNGEFPPEVEDLCTLPGIGKSTAGAIRSIAFQQPASILDGNVKRVLARYRAIDGWPGRASVLKQLWQVANELTPLRRVANYSQAMMDLGATICTRSSPSCTSCPLQDNCQALAQAEQLRYPGKKPRKALPVKSTTLLMISAANGDVWLERRPGTGIWGGLWCFPELSADISASDWCVDVLGIAPHSRTLWASFRHTFSHYHLDIQPLQVHLATTPETVMEAQRQLWYNMRQPPKIGLAAPVASLLNKLGQTSKNMDT